MGNGWGGVGCGKRPLEMKKRPFFCARRFPKNNHPNRPMGSGDVAPGYVIVGLQPTRCFPRASPERKIPLRLRFLGGRGRMAVGQWRGLLLRYHSLWWGRVYDFGEGNGQRVGREGAGGIWVKQTGFVPRLLAHVLASTGGERAARQGLLF
jgi:hypothetical protein